MAKVTRVNLRPVNSADAMFQLMEFLRDDMGGTLTITGDGLAAFNGAGASVITHEGSGAGGMNNTGAHFTYQDPAAVYEWCFEKGTGVIWDVIISPIAGFTGGAAATRPTATDEEVVHSIGLFPPDNTYRWHISGDTTPIGATVAVYPWRAFCVDGTGLCDTLIGHEPMEPGSYPELVGTRASPTTGEPDPCLYMVQYQVSGGSMSLNQNPPGWSSETVSPGWGFFCLNGTNGQTEAFTRFLGGMQYAGGVVSPGNLGVDPRTGLDAWTSIPVGRAQRLTQPGPKGEMATLRSNGVGRPYPSVVDIDGSRYVCAYEFLVPFEDGVTPLT